MANTQFVVDLGDVKLSNEQKNAINAAVQKAVTGELANISSTSRLALFPVGGRWPRFPGPIIWGIIARPVDDRWLKDIGTLK
ncbi:MAG: hypothetical protein JWN83_2047 [Chitinophagaceae bacterium]|nr:hypothetical protein [Chitinophagaceae bacterium]